MIPLIKAFFDSATWTISYVVFDEPKGSCAIIDPVLDYEPKSSRTSTRSADKLIEFVNQQQLHHIIASELKRSMLWLQAVATMAAVHCICSVA